MIDVDVGVSRSVQQLAANDLAVARASLANRSDLQSPIYNAPCRIITFATDSRQPTRLSQAQLCKRLNNVAK
jgi:hypothetical protein